MCPYDGGGNAEPDGSSRAEAFPKNSCPPRGGSNVDGAKDGAEGAAFDANGLAEEENDMPDILHRVGIAAPSSRVYDVLTSVDGHRGWWDQSATGDAKRGGLLTFFQHVDMRVVETRPDELVKWRCVRGPGAWMNTEVTFQLVYRDDQTFVLFTHADWKRPEELMHHCSTKWATFLLSLKALVETGRGRPAPDEVMIYVGG